MSHSHNPYVSSPADQVDQVGRTYLHHRKVVFGSLFWLSLAIWLSTFVLNLAQYGTLGLYVAALLYLVGVAGVVIFGLWFLHADHDYTANTLSTRSSTAGPTDEVS